MLDPDKVKQLRINANMTQREVSQRSGLTIKTISLIENGRDRVVVDTIEKLAAAFNVEPKELLK